MNLQHLTDYEREVLADVRQRESLLMTDDLYADMGYCSAMYTLLFTGAVMWNDEQTHILPVSTEIEERKS